MTAHADDAAIRAARARNGGCNRAHAYTYG